MSILSIIAFLFKASGILFLLLISLIILLLIVLPLLKMQHYKKQGLSCYFYPLVGLNKRDKIYEQKTGDILGYYKELPKTDPNLPAVVANAGPRVDLLLFDPKMLKEFFQNPSNYQKSHASGVVKMLMGTGLFLAEGEQWKRNRKAIASTFHFDFLKQSLPLVVKTTRELLDKLASDMKNVNVMDEIQKITGEMVGRIFFSENLNNYNLKGQPLTLYLASLLGRLGLLFRNPKIMLCLLTSMNPEKVAAYREFLAEINEFRQFCLKIVQDRKTSNSKCGDLLEMLLETQKSGNLEDQFSDIDIVNEFITFFVAGMDTTGHLITMILYMLHKHPESLEKIKKEISETYPRGDDIPSYDELNKMEYMHSVIKETLRMYNPAPVYVPRIAQADHKLGNIQIKKGMSVRAIPLYNSFNPKYFEEPDQFIPERWTSKKENDMDPFTFIPFSTGPRNCIGQHLAVIETKVIMVEFVKKFDFKMSKEDYKLRMSFASLYEPKEKIMMDLQKK